MDKDNNGRDPGWEFEKHQFINSKSPSRINKEKYTPGYITMKHQKNERPKGKS